jgi:3-dehydrosphinganine reductase
MFCAMWFSRFLPEQLFQSEYHMNIDGKLSLLTGGSSGIGLALAKKLAAQGAHVWILARDPARLKAACEEIRAARRDPQQQVGAITADVADDAQVRAALEAFAGKTGVPDLLVNCAGITRPGYFTELDIDIFRSMMEVNYFGTLNVIKALLPGMIQRKSGHIVNVSSLAGMFAVYGYSAYGPSKFAIRGLTDSLRYELKEHNIGVSLVFPPDTQTPQLEFEAPYKPPILVELDKGNKILTADAVADSILKGIARDRYIITPGFDSSLYFQLTNFFGLVYPVMDIMVAQARRVLRGQGNGTAKNNSRH